MAEERCGGMVAHAKALDSAHPLAERRTLWVLILTALAMVVEILAGGWYGSMALLADGWYMSSHVIARGLSVAAYWRGACGAMYVALECVSREQAPGIIA